jgi:hypothetical protein
MTHVFPKLSSTRKTSERIKAKAMGISSGRSKIAKSASEYLKSIDIYG